MILVDTSIWIELLNGRLSESLTHDDLRLVVTCGPIVQEVLQGLRDHPAAKQFRSAFLAVPCLSDPLPLSSFLEASEIYRLGRQKGFTVRSSTDCLIAAIAIRHQIPVWHRDRDYANIARFTALQTIDKAEA